MVDKCKYKKPDRFSRVLAGFIFFIVAYRLIGLAFVLVNEPFDADLLYLVGIEVLVGHISGSVLFTGYAPGYLLFAHRHITANAGRTKLMNLLLAGVVCSFIAYWMFRFEGEYVFFAMSVIGFLSLIMRTGPPKFGGKKEQSEGSGAGHE